MRRHAVVVAVAGAYPSVASDLAGRVRDLHRSGARDDESHGALLYAGHDAALGADASAYLLGITRVAPRVIDVLVPRHRRVRSQHGLAVPYGDLDGRVVPSAPRRLRRAATVVALLRSARDDDALVALLCSGVRAGCSPGAVRAELARWQRFPRRDLLDDLVADVAEGIESPLERRYHHGVERLHGLPRARLQQRHRLAGLWIVRYRRPGRPGAALARVGRCPASVQAEMSRALTAKGPWMKTPEPHGRHSLHGTACAPL